MSTIPNLQRITFVLYDAKIAILSFQSPNPMYSGINPRWILVNFGHLLSRIHAEYTKPRVAKTV
ncbi:hypothetical protein GCM10028809_26680 [Spirosoma gilvum]